MPYTMYELSDGQNFYYDTLDNSLYNQNGELLSLPPLHSKEWYEVESARHGTSRKSDTPYAVRLLMGHACNYSCTYCMQKDIGNPNERGRNMQLDQFIHQFKTFLNPERLKRIELWGGEPFLYWKDMIEIMNMTDAPHREFFISTNGSPLRQKHVDFFASLQAQVLINISHDGPGQKSLSGDDILENIMTVQTIKNLMALPNTQVGFGAVVSKTNYDLFEINDYFKNFADANDIKDLKLTFIPAKNYDETNSQGSADHVINGEDLAKFDVIMKKYIEKCLQDPKYDVLLKNNIFESEEGIYSYAKFLANQAPITTTSGCGADADDVLSLDMKGNVRLCPHTDESYISGHISSIPLVDVTRLNLNRKTDHCYACPFKRLCRSSCPINFPDETFYSNCRFEKVWWGNIQLTAMKILFRQDVKIVKEGLNEIKP